MTLLAIDTSEQACSVALVENSHVLDSRSEIIGRGHAERLLPLIAERLAAHGLSYGDLTRIAVTTGPGTFTGLRIGLSVARGLALQADIPCIGLTGLQVLAAQAMDQVNDGQPVHAMITGRGGQAFYQTFQGRGGNGLPMPLNDPVGLDAEDIAERVNALGGVLAGSGVSLLEEKGLLDAMKAQTAPDGGSPISPGMLGQLARLLSATDYPPEPTYFRAADAKKAVPVLPVVPGATS